MVHLKVAPILNCFDYTNSLNAGAVLYLSSSLDYGRDLVTILEIIQLDLVLKIFPRESVWPAAQKTSQLVSRGLSLYSAVIKDTWPPILPPERFSSIVR